MQLRAFLKIIIIACLLLASNCQHQEIKYIRNKLEAFDQKYMDDDLGLKVEDYQDYFSNSQRKESQDQEGSFVPKKSYYDDEDEDNLIESAINPTDRKLFSKEKTITLTLSNEIDVKDVLMEISRLAKLDIEMDPNISGGIILSVKNKPISEVINRVAELANLRYKITNNTMRFEKDVPYYKTYTADFMNIIRNNRSSYQVNVGLQGSENGANSGNNSSSQIVTTQDGNLWKTLENEIKQILGVNENNNKEDKDHNYVSTNREAGLISIFAPQKKHKTVEKYLNKVKHNISAQVLIEAKVVEVSLKDEFKSGINWNILDRKLKIGINTDFLSPVGSFTTGAGEFSMGILSNSGVKKMGSRFNTADINNLNQTVSMLDYFGVSRILSSPRVHAMNNQQAVLSFAQNHVYFKLDIEQNNNTTTTGSTTTTTPSQVNVKSELKTVPIGLILNLQPSINLENQEITMNIRPTISRIVGTKKDPSIVYALKTAGATLNTTDLSSEVPVVEVKEMDSLLKVRSGEIMVIGGMMEERVDSNDSGVPIVKTLPVVGRLFKSTGKVKSTVQTLILLKATIVGTKSTYNNKDKEFIDKFTNDPNPFKMQKHIN